VKFSPGPSLLRLAIISAGLVSIVLGIGCSKPKDVTKDPSYGNFTNAVGTWKTKIPLSLQEMDKRIYLLGTNTFFPRGRLLSVVPVGTAIRIERLMLYAGWDASVTEATGSLVAGPYAGKILVLDGNVFFPRPSAGKRDWTVLPENFERSAPTAGVTQ
jgi:hypothetical protein